MILNQRASAINVGCPWRSLYPVDIAVINANARAQIAYMYGAFLSPKISSRNETLQDPVNCVMAGDQREFRRGRASFNALRGIFRE